jgi:PKD repeat protein
VGGNGHGIAKEEWSFGDGESGSGSNTCHTYRKEGNYEVILTITNDCGETNTKRWSLRVTKDTGRITFKCAHNDKYCDRGATIQYREKGASAWETFGKKTSSYAVTADLDAGVYEVKYNLLNVMGCQGEVTVKAGETVDFDKQMSSLLPEVIRTTVTAIIDGDSIRTAYTDDSRFPPPSSRAEHQELRLIGYDSEECEHYPDVCAPGGAEAGDFLKKLLPIGTEIELRIFRWLPLGAHNRIIAGVFKDGEDIAKKMLSSCFVKLVDSKYYDKYPWIKWEGENSYEAAWCDPTKTNVTISTSDAAGASMNVDVIMFDNEMKGSSEGGVTIKKVLPGKHTIEIRDAILEDGKLWAYVLPLSQAFKVPCIFDIEVQPGKTYRVRVQLGLKEEQLPTPPVTPPYAVPPVTGLKTMTVTSDSAIPLWIWDADGEEKLPCTRFNAMAGGTAFGITVCKDGYDKMATLIIPHTHIVPPFTMPFDITLSDSRTPVQLHGRYTGTVYIDGGKGEVHVKLTSYPTVGAAPPVTPPVTGVGITKEELIAEWGKRGAIDLSLVSTVPAANKWHMYYNRLSWSTPNFEKAIEISNLQTRNPPTQVSDIAWTENRKSVQELDRAWILARLDELVRLYGLALPPIVPLTSVSRRITFSTSPSLAKIYVDGRVSTAKIIHINKGKHLVTFAAIKYDTLNVELKVSSDGIECLTKAVCGYKTKKPYVLFAKDYIRAYLKPVDTASSFSRWMQMKGGGEGIGLDEIIDILRAYKAKKDIGFMPTLDNLIKVVKYYRA